MEQNILIEDDDGLCIGDIDFRVFKLEIKMLGSFKRALLRRKLKKEKIKLLCELMEINKKLKALDDLDKEKNKEK